MSSNNYDSYNYPYHQQSSAQQYSSYQTAPASNTNAQSSRQYQQAPSTSTNQPADYLSYPGPSYGSSSSGYGNAQDDTWSDNSTSYGTTRDNGSRAAKVLRNMSNTGYSATTPTPSQSGFTATNAANAQYSERSPQVQAQPSQPFHATYSQTQARLHSVNTNQAQASTSRGLSSPATAAGYPLQRPQQQYHQQQAQQRTASPAQTQYGQHSATAASRNVAMAAVGTSQQHTNYNRQLPDVDSSQSSQSLQAATSYTARPPAPIVPPHPSSIPESYSGSSTTVDPTAVYDPWPEIQRQQAIRDAERREREKKEEEALMEKERAEEEECKQQGAEEEPRQAQMAASQPKPRAKNAEKQQVPAAAESPDPSTAGAVLEAEIRAMMAKIRELNGKDPVLLARIWEEERRAKAPNKSPTLTTKPAPQASIVPPIIVPTPPVANQRKIAKPRESLSTPVIKPATPAQARPLPSRVPAATHVRTGGNTVWPPEKKLGLAKAAAHYLTTKNPAKPLETGEVLQMLNGNPSYVQLCEQLEQMGFKLDRSIFARSLLLAVPDVNAASRRTALQPVPPAAALRAPAPPAVMKQPAPLAVMKNPIATPGVAPGPRYAPVAATPINNRSSYPPFPNDDSMAAPSPIPVAEMILIKPELKPPANKEEAARKRNLSDLVDLTQLDDEDDIGPLRKRLNAGSMYAYGSSYPHINDATGVGAAPVSNFPTASTPVPVMAEPPSRPLPSSETRFRLIVEPLDKKKALRRNTYNPATIARDVLLACGRHPSERQLNQHLEVLKVNLPQISYESDLSTIKWSLIDPGTPPPGYFKDSVQALTEDADDEEDSEDEERHQTARRGSLYATGGESARNMVQALPEATNPFKEKRRDPARHSLPNTTTPSTPSRQTSSANMSASAPRSAVAGVGYSAFRSATEFGPDGKPLPKRKGRPVGWRKAIHGSSAAQERPGMNGHTGKHAPRQPSTLRDVRAGDEPTYIDSRSPSVSRAPQYQSFKCKWQNCKAELHNLETLQKHVFKVHNKETLRNTLECLWDDCGKEITSFDPISKTSIERHTTHAFGAENAWRQHIQRTHFDPLAWEQGDGPAGGLSEHDSEAYLRDAQGRRITPRITASPVDYEIAISLQQPSEFTLRGRGRLPKDVQEQEARELQNRLVSQKRRMGGPGMDRGGATLVNDKRRRGLVDSDVTEEELVDAED
ncbi:uncharacterized protein M421DRAFT_57223 [Didymella exigua CBS 183.55]|uniref:C2H2-type domain-containing protein n=1 Tax=Didymella exigua CBS 183.55 TaxID=1150837 RepID=A0A6A5RUR0_9PLEO|nr:uncharacterized protein M421DRAFT_57223 [Didymella exigua CBS 183.55]KAF1930894.1 hypothetical protein M421DRAFT_57223 [Didymella exigua CBS 183.55]